MSLDPVTIAILTSAVSVLGSEYTKGVASEAGKSTWSGVKSIFSWAKDPAPADIPEQVATALLDSPQLAHGLWELLKNNQGAGISASMVGKIEGEKIIVIQTNYGSIDM